MKSKNSKQEKKKNNEEKSKDDKQKIKGLGIEAKKEENFPVWYQQVITQAELIEYYDVSGCYILRPRAYFVWEQIKEFIDSEIKKFGVENAYFPLFVSKKALTTEKEHIEGFAAEVAWVTHSGESKLAEPIAVRPTSETIIYPAYAKWIRSHRDLPLKLNQWCNVVRWEFKNPTPFLRSREFLWQEGHTVFATKEEADKEVLDILEIYKKVFEDILAIPVIKGKKSQNEKFAGGLYTTTVEAFIPTTGKGIQGGTSHCLGQNFSKMFGIEFENEKEEKQYAWQNSWGMSTRTIGAMIMVHSDDKGLVLPPKVAPIQVVIIPILLSSQEESEKKAQIGKSEEIRNKLKALGIRVNLDDRLGYSPGWKYNHWELKGVPIRIELGPKDMKTQQVAIARRDTGEKLFISWDKVDTFVFDLMTTIHTSMFEKALKIRDEHLLKADTWDKFITALNSKNIILSPWCNREKCEDNVKERSFAKEIFDGTQISSTGAKTLCLPFEAEEITPGTKCFACGEDALVRALWGRTY